MKQLLLNPIIGKFALTTRNKYDLFKAALKDLESISTLANDQLASHLIARLCISGKIFVDVGAHIGSVIFDVHNYNPLIEIHAIEAIHEKVIKLRKKFPNVNFIECAAGDKEKEVSFFVNKKKSGYSSLKRPSNKKNNLHEIKVLMKKLDNILPHKNIDVMKIDVEGFELNVIRGALKILSANNPTIMFESGPDNNRDSISSLYRQFSDLNYSILIPNRVAHNDEGLTLEGFLESHLYPRRTTNYFAISSHRRIEIRDRARNILDI